MRWLKLLVRGAMWLVLLAAMGLLVTLVAIPRVNGWVPLTVLSGSMTPTYPVGSQVVVERVDGPEDANKLKVGDIITFMPRAGDSSLTTHRIVQKVFRQDGVAIFTTRGDANNSDDPYQLTEQQIRGKARYHVPYAGYVATALTQDKKNTGIYILGGGLLLYSAAQTILAALSRRSRAKRRAGHRAEPGAGHRYGHSVGHRYGHSVGTSPGHRAEPVATNR